MIAEILKEKVGRVAVHGDFEKPSHLPGRLEGHHMLRAGSMLKQDMRWPQALTSG